MFKMYAGCLSGNSLYLESTNKEELIEKYNEFAKTNTVLIAQLVEDLDTGERKDLTEELKVNNKNLDTIFD